ncbi:hypothetical protein SSPO_002510 [Streptomyces antimycoticus]|uniref:Uncharacterized protein n=1 Tax=Streptomyces antimycoticus TaxID=68175 RepID=A0A499UAF0_9ACTN|nr:hypothetical protein SSPO_002510 [Streptomyces antimycoticus]
MGALSRAGPGSLRATRRKRPGWTATLLEVAGACPDPAFPRDGVSLAGYLLRGKNVSQRGLFWRQEIQHVLRRGKWKYLRAANAGIPVDDNKDVLFVLEQDPGEGADRATHEPELRAGLKGAGKKADASLLPYPAAQRPSMREPRGLHADRRPDRDRPGQHGLTQATAQALWAIDPAEAPPSISS